MDQRLDEELTKRFERDILIRIVWNQKGYPDKTDDLILALHPSTLLYIKTFVEISFKLMSPSLSHLSCSKNYVVSQNEGDTKK
jgi:hypothetical protein